MRGCGASTGESRRTKTLRHDSRGPRDKKTPRWSAERRAPSAEGAHASHPGVDTQEAPLGAPSPSEFPRGKNETGLSADRCTSLIRPAKRWLFDN